MDELSDPGAFNGVRRAQELPPGITAGPHVRVTQTGAIVGWRTDRAADSVVEYGQPAGIYPGLASDPRRVREHRVRLSSLQPGTTYHFRVRSADVSGNTAYGEDRTFTTRLSGRGKAPRVTLVQPAQYRGRVEIAAVAEDGTPVGKAEFALDDTPIFTAYSPPFEVTLNTELFENGEHSLKLRCTGQTGKTAETLHTVLFCNIPDQPPQVTIVSPATGATVDGKVEIEAHATDDQGVLAAWLYVDGTRKGIAGLADPPSKDITFGIDWDASKEQEGNHHLEVLVYDTSIKTATAHIDLTVLHVAPPPEPTPPDLRVISRSVTRIGNYLDVQMSVRNFGDLPAANIHIFDELEGFQAISVADAAPGTVVRSRWFPTARSGDVEIVDDNPLPHDSQVTYKYRLVPVLAHPNPKTPAIGTVTSLDCDGPGGPIPRMLKQPTYSTTTGETIPQAHAAACKTANYLIVTNPIRLIGLNCPAYYSGFGTATCWHDTNNVLSNMARLAVAKQGVLGYFHGKTADELRDLIRTGWTWLPPMLPGWPSTGVSTGAKGTWAQQLHESFTAPGRGWLLIVGEYQIVPSWTITGIGVAAHDDGSDYIRQSDFRYADTMGDERPELIVGRIIGDTPADLVRGLQASLGVHYNWPGYGNDSSHALALSGAGKFVDDFVDSVNYLAGQLAGKGTSVSVIHQKYLGEDKAGTDQAVSDFKALVPGRDFILLDGHGLPKEVGPLSVENLPGTDFHGTNPVIWSEACLAGNYDYLTETQPAPVNGTISEQFFLLDAGGYFGSTEIGSASVGKTAVHYVADHWTKTMPPAYQFFLLKDWFGGWWASAKCRGFNYEYNYYGDPKLGKTALDPLEMSGIAKIQQPLTGMPPGLLGPAQVAGPSRPDGIADHLLDVDVPDVSFASSQGIDHVLLPGGMPQVEDGLPDVPSYSATFTYAPGTVVQHVLLRDRAGLREGTGLKLALVVDGPNGPSRPAEPAGGNGWYPATDFQWRTSANPDGSTRLTILIFPFHYNSSTGEYRFHRTYRFAVRTAQATAAIVAVSTDRPAYRNEQPVAVTAEILNRGMARDLVLNVAVRETRRGQAVDGLPVRTLTRLQGHAALTQQWLPEKLPPGEYLLDAELRELDGTLLDRKKEYIRIGVQEARILSLTATPHRFRPGQAVSMCMMAANSGSLPIRGTAVLRVVDSRGTTVAEFTQPVTGLQPDEVTHLRGRWETSEATHGDYSAIGYLLFDSRATDPLTTNITTSSSPRKKEKADRSAGGSLGAHAAA